MDKRPVIERNSDRRVAADSAYKGPERRTAGERRRSPRIDCDPPADPT